MTGEDLRGEQTMPEEAIILVKARAPELAAWTNRLRRIARGPGHSARRRRCALRRHGRRQSP